jgi:hypothetical protein
MDLSRLLTKRSGHGKRPLRSPMVRIRRKRLSTAQYALLLLEQVKQAWPLRLLLGL